MVSGEVAATTLTDNNLSNIIGDTPTDDDGNLNDTLIADDFTPASKIAYDSAIALNLNLLNFFLLFSASYLMFLVIRIELIVDSYLCKIFLSMRTYLSSASSGYMQLYCFPIFII